MKTIQIKAILAVLSKEDQTKVEAILKGVRPFSDLDSDVNQLKAILRPHAQALEKIGILADYAAYTLPYVVLTGKPLPPLK